MPATARARQDLALTLMLALLLLAWDASGLDLAAAQLFGNAQGFALRDNGWTSRVLHDGGRALSWALLALLAASTWRQPAAGMPTRARRWCWIGVVLLCALLVPALKRGSGTSCPWDLQAFGGVAQHVSHWAWWRADGGPGRCFPSGHAVSAFAFLPLFFLWRDAEPRRARAVLVAVLLAAALLGAAQLARGAHYPSHTLWSGWFCWVIAVLAAQAETARASRLLPA